MFSRGVALVMIGALSVLAGCAEQGAEPDRRAEPGRRQWRAQSISTALSYVSPLIEHLDPFSGASVWMRK